VLGKESQFAVISFQGGRLKIMINLRQKSNLIRNLMDAGEVPKVFEYLKTCRTELPAKSSERYNINLKKIKSADIFQLAEVIKDLSELSKTKKLSPKELSMLKQSKKMMGTEISHITGTPVETAEAQIEAVCRGDS
jgi:CarD family transcriptional regulator